VISHKEWARQHVTPEPDAQMLEYLDSPLVWACAASDDAIAEEDARIPAQDSDALDDIIDRELLRRAIRDALMALNEREREVLEMRFGFADGEEHTLREVGASFGVTSERIRKIQQKALRRLRHPMRSSALRAFMD